MARELKKPKVVKEGDLKEYAGDVIIDVTPRKDPPKRISPLVKAPFDLEAASANAAKPNTAPASNLMAFNVWFQKLMNAKPRMKLSYKEAIEAHCKAMGFGSKATEEQYNKALEHFGL